jgi:hypothetical protein
VSCILSVVDVSGSMAVEKQSGIRGTAKANLTRRRQVSSVAAGDAVFGAKSSPAEDEMAASFRSTSRRQGVR